MTGYGRAQGQWEGRTFIVELKSVNHRYRDINLRLPRRYSPLEPRFRDLVENKYVRGRLELYLNSKDGEAGLVEPEINIPLADCYHKMCLQLQERYGIQEHLSVFHLLTLPDVVIHRDKELDPEKEWTFLEQLTSAALLELNDMRAKEGGLLFADMESRVQEMKTRLGQIENLSSLVVDMCHQRLSRRMAELTSGMEIDPLRVAQEVAFFADRCDITEEIVRLRSHMDQCAQVLQEDGPVGRKLDFILQEMNREINTIGSKASDSQITQHVIEFKTDLERLREQVQNIE